MGEFPILRFGLAHRLMQVFLSADIVSLAT